MEQTNGMMKSGPHIDYEGNSLIHHNNNTSILAKAKLEIMQ